ncbi:MAG: class I SAM-dependent methyltransferase [Patescibacteria group bacterium]
MENEWDRISDDYSQSIGEHGDAWRQLVINPSILGVLKPIAYGSKVLDLGCGEGYLARLLKPAGFSYTGIDNSQKLLNLAMVKKSPGEFKQKDITEPLGYKDQFEVVIANMVLNGVDDVEAVCQNAWLALKLNGIFIVTIPHPVFRRPGAQLAKTIFGKISRRDPFIRINAYTNPFFKRIRIKHIHNFATVFHRSLSFYVQTPLNQGFRLLDIQETSPTKDQLVKYNQPIFFTKFPQVLFMVFSKDE